MRFLLDNNLSPALAENLNAAKHQAVHVRHLFWVAADEVYGRSALFRETCRAMQLSYVMIIPCDYHVTIARETSARADALVNDAVFEHRSCGNGTRGPRYGDWAMIATARPREFLLIRRLDREKSPYTFYLCWAPEDKPATMTYFITIAGRRWQSVEVTFKTAKDTLSWDQSQVRTWQAMNRHTVLTALAQARTAAIRGALADTVTLPDIPRDSPPAPPDCPRGDDVTGADLDVPRGDAPLPAYAAGIPPVRLSGTESLRISNDTADYAAGLLSRACLAFRRRWSRWRRRHQARARWHYYSSRIQGVAT